MSNYESKVKNIFSQMLNKENKHLKHNSLFQSKVKITQLANSGKKIRLAPQEYNTVIWFNTTFIILKNHSCFYVATKVWTKSNTHLQSHLKNCLIGSGFNFI